MPNYLIGIIFASIAAALNGTIGVISKLLMFSGLNSNDIAFFKTLIAFIIISIILSRTPQDKQFQIIDNSKGKKKIKLIFHVAVCAFLGIFVLFFFETAAYKYGNASNVVVILMASAAVSALVFGRLILLESINLSIMLGASLAISGIFIISWSGGSTFLLLLNAILAGLGYGLFSVLIKKFQLQGGIHLTRLLLLFGVIYLAIPFLQTAHPIQFSFQTIVGLLALALLPTLLGFYCTTKALHYMSASKVQVTELSEPIFAAILAWLFLQEIPTPSFAVGTIFILLGILLINNLHHYVLQFMRR